MAIRFILEIPIGLYLNLPGWQLAVDNDLADDVYPGVFVHFSFRQQPCHQ